MRDKIEDVLSVLKIIQTEFQKSVNYASIPELRKIAVKIVAEDEFGRNRYLNIDSANKSIHDACVRRLRPDVKRVADFDNLVEQWLRKGSDKLKNTMLKNAKNSSHERVICGFFL